MKTFFFFLVLPISLNSSHFLTPACAASSLPSHVTILTKEDFIGRPFFSVADALEGTTAINIERYGYQGTKSLLKMRGLSQANQSTVLIDGEPLTHQFDGDVDLSQIPINIVERIEISRGGGSVSLPVGGAGGVINIITIRPKEKGLDSRIGTGVGRDGVKHSHGQFAGRSHLGDLTYLGSIEDSGGFLSNEDSESSNHFANFTRSFNGKGYWGAEYFFQESKTGLGEGTSIPFSEWNAHAEQQSTDEFKYKREENQHAKVFLAQPLLFSGTTYLTVTQRNREFNIFPYEKGPSILDQTNQSLETNLKWRRKESEIGIAQINLKRNIFAQNENKAIQRSAYFLNKWSGKKWTFLPGIRGEYHSESKGVVDPRLAVVFDKSTSLSFSGSIQTNHRFPNFDELFFSSSVTSNQNLNPEKSVTLNAGTSWSPAPHFSARITGFLTRINEAVVTDNNNRLTNAGKEKISGLETAIGYEAGHETRYRHFQVMANWTTQRNRQETPYNGLGETTSPMAPENMGLLTLDYFLPRKITITNQLRYQSEQFQLSNKSGVRVPGYTIWNLRILVKIITAELYFEAHNLNRRKFSDTVTAYGPSAGSTQVFLLPQPERIFWTGISIRFDN